MSYVYRNKLMFCSVLIMSTMSTTTYKNTNESYKDKTNTVNSHYFKLFNIKTDPL